MQHSLLVIVPLPYINSLLDPDDELFGNNSVMVLKNVGYCFVLLVGVQGFQLVRDDRHLAFGVYFRSTQISRKLSEGCLPQVKVSGHRVGPT